MDDTTQQNTPQPVAYDADGRPLYASPEDAMNARPQPAPQPTVVHMAQPLERVEQTVSPELQRKHEQSVEAYPHLDLSEHEYVVLCVRRHLIGLIGPIFAALFLLIIFIAFLVLLPEITTQLGVQNLSGLLLLGVICISILLLGGIYMVYWVYTNNSFFLTNQSIIEKTQHTLFSSNVKSVSLGDVVDVSYRQVGLLQTMLNYGTVQVGTKDDEVPYIFNYVRDPKSQASTIKDAVTSFKNGRGFGGEADLAGQGRPY